MPKLTLAELRAAFPDASEQFYAANASDAPGPDATAGGKRRAPKAKSPLAGQSEADFQREVIAYLRAHGWHVLHVHDSRRQAGDRAVGDADAAGLPDLIAIKPPRVWFIELKAVKGKLRPAQETVLGLLYRCAEVRADVLRPTDWDAIRALSEAA